MTFARSECVFIVCLMISDHQRARKGAVRAEKEGTQTRDISSEGGESSGALFSSFLSEACLLLQK